MLLQLTLGALLAPTLAAPASGAVALNSAPAPFEPAAAPDMFALRVGRAETIDQGTIPHAVILVEDGKIVTVGQDLPIERGIPVVDLPDAVVTPGFVDCRSRLGLESRGGNSAQPQARVIEEFRPHAGVFRTALESGVTTFGLYPAGNGVPGQAAAVRPSGSSVDEMLIDDFAYLMMYVRADRNAKKVVRGAFESVDKYMEKVEKAREKWEKDQEKAKSKKKKSKDDDEDEDKEDEEEDDKKSILLKDDEFEPPVPDDDVLAMLQLLNGETRALVGIRKAADYLHMLDVFKGREFEYDVQIDLRNELDLFYIAEQMGEDSVRLVLDPLITLHPGTRRERNLPKELSDAGVSIAFVPREDTAEGHELWLGEVARLVRYGLDADVALRAMTLEPAAVLGLDDELGSLTAGKVANMVVFDGDPLAPDSEILAVLLEGEVVAGDLDL